MIRVHSGWYGSSVIPAQPQAAGLRDEPIADPRRRAQAREYAGIRRRLLLLDLALSVATLVVLLASGASVWLRAALERAVPGEIGVVAAYVAALAIGYALVFLPLSYYSGFTLPHRYDLSVQSRAGWAADYAKVTLVGLAQAVIATEAIYALLRVAPATWWLWAALVLTLFTVLLTNLAPVLILPLFFKLRPLEDVHLSDRLIRLAAAAGAHVRGVYVMDLIQRTRAANAALIGLGNTQRIVLGDTLWARFDPGEIEAVLAHELGHHVHHDLWRGIALESTLIFVALWLADRLMWVF